MMGKLNEYYQDMSDTSNSESQKQSQVLSQSNENINEVQQTSFRSEISGAIEDKKSQISSLGCRSSNIEENLSSNKIHWFKDRPETIAHEVMVDALK